MISRFILVLAICLAFFFCSNSFGVEVEDLTYMTEDYRPYNYVNEKGELTGISVELLKVMWQKMGVSEQPINVYPWARGYYLLKSRENHVLFATSKTREREGQFKWVGPLYQIKAILISTANRNILIESLNDAKLYQVGTVREDVSEQLLLDAGFKVEQLQRVGSFEQNLKKLQRGRVDLVAITDKSLSDFIKAGYLGPFECKAVFTISEIKSYYAFNKNVSDDLIEKYQAVLDDSKSEHQQILNRYFANPH